MKKLTPDKILDIYNEAEGTYKEIAKKYKVSASCVSHIKTGERHSDITGASKYGSARRNTPYVNKAKAQAVFDYINDPDKPRTKEEASFFFDLPLYTIRRILKDYTRKYHIRHVTKNN